MSVLSPRGPDSCHKLPFYNQNNSANSAPLSDVFRFLLSHGLTIVTCFCVMEVVKVAKRDVTAVRSLVGDLISVDNQQHPEAFSFLSWRVNVTTVHNSFFHVTSYTFTF